MENIMTPISICIIAKNEEDEEKIVKFEDPCKNISLEEAKKRIEAGEPYTIRQTNI